MSALSQIVANPSLAYYYAQKGVRVPVLRRAFGATVAMVMRLRGGKLHEPADTAITGRLTAELEQTGYASLPEKIISSDRLAAIRQELDSRPLYDYYGSGKRYALADIPTQVVKVRYDNADVLACRGLMDLANDPDILHAVAQRLGATPTLASAEAWWTFGEHNQAGDKAFDDIYHRDADDLRFVKLFVYLTDTGLTNGAHRFVLGSHADFRFARRGPIHDADVENAYPPASMLTVTGKAGTGFLEETWGIHRAMLATEGRRLMFSAIYALAAHMPFAPARPLLPLPDGYNQYVNRMLFY